jgi:hypothetical protein
MTTKVPFLKHKPWKSNYFILYMYFDSLREREEEEDPFGHGNDQLRRAVPGLDPKSFSETW